MAKKVQRSVDNRVKPMSPTAGLKKSTYSSKGKKTRTYGKGGKCK